MFERGVDFFAVGHLIGGCWDSCIRLELKAGLMTEWRLSADNFDFCLLTVVIGEEERREILWCMTGILMKGNYCMALKICC